MCLLTAPRTLELVRIESDCEGQTELRFKLQSSPTVLALVQRVKDKTNKDSDLVQLGRAQCAVRRERRGEDTDPQQLNFACQHYRVAV